jgi:thiamine biosynthesis lipoprotein
MYIKNNAIFCKHNSLGIFEKYRNLKGKRYTHIIDPRTGYPSNGIINVTVFAPKVELTDAIATSVFVMGKEAGLDRINQSPKNRMYYHR